MDPPRKLVQTMRALWGEDVKAEGTSRITRGSNPWANPVLAELSASPAESRAVNRLVDRRLLFECAVTHYAAINATAEQLDELDRLTRDMAESTDWSDYHQADEQFHQLGGIASGLGTAVEAYHETLTELYADFIPYPIELLHKSNCDHVALVAALRAGDGNEAVEISRKHVDILHGTMFMGLSDGGATSTPE